MKEAGKNHLWWQTGIIYEVYVRSFQDSDGDGTGDLQGILQRLDYLKWLGITAIWLTPVYPSPMKDFGYDITGYTAIHPLFGTMELFDQLVKEIHARDMKLIMDLVPNHTSDQHPWFLESRSSRDNPKRAWYIWKDAKEDGREPNNWLSVFGGSAWEWDEKTGQYYYHAFIKEQPDLNLRNPEVQEAIFGVMRFWLDKGVDGFRVDVMWHLVKDELFRDNPVNPDYQPHMPECDRFFQVYSCDQPEVHDIVRKMRRVTDEYGERLLIGELYIPMEKIVAYYGTDNRGVHLPANFVLLFLPWEAQTIARTIDEYEGILSGDAWPNWIIGNHDRPRLISCIGAEQARVAALLLLTLRGTPTLYNGDEIGMNNVPVPPEEVKDPQGLLQPDKNISRDPQRSPMLWNSSENAGFTTGTPWLRIDENFRHLNVQVQKDDPCSMLSLYRRMIALRQRQLSLMVGNYTPVYSDPQLIAYTRRAEGDPAFLVVLNLTHSPARFSPEHTSFRGTVVVSTSPEKEGTEVGNIIDLDGDEGIVVQLTE